MLVNKTIHPPKEAYCVNFNCDSPEIKEVGLGSVNIVFSIVSPPRVFTGNKLEIPFGSNIRSTLGELNPSGQ